MEKKIIDILINIIKSSFSAGLAICGVILIYLGLIGKAVMPESFFAGIVILGFSILYYIGEMTHKIIKIFKCCKNVNKE